MSSNEIADFARRHPKIGIDTNVLIALIEQHADYGALAETVFKHLDANHNEVWFSVISITELLIHPAKQGNFQAKRDYETVLFNSPYSFAELDSTVAKTAAVIGGKYNLKVIDALILASLVHQQVTGFITADKKLSLVDDVEVFCIA